MKIKTVEWFDDRWYKIEYEKDEKTVIDYFPSTTTKLNIISKPFLARWRGDVGNREADMRIFEASERGVRIHHGWYTMVSSGAVIYQPFQRPNYNESEISELTDKYFGNLAVIRYQDEMFDLVKLKKWLDAVKPNIIASETTVYSLTNRDAGTLDNLFYIEGGKYLINGKTPLLLPKGLYVADLKTGNLDENAFLQTACYAKCCEEMGMGEIVGTLILHTGSRTKTGIEGLSTQYHNREEIEKDYQNYRLASALWESKNADKKPEVFEFPTLLTKENENEKPE